MSFNFGLLVNPKNGDFVYADAKRRIVRIFRLDNREVGSGYFDDGSKKYGWTHDVTGLPRVHTPEALEPDVRGGGYGTVLYTALCYAAHLADNGELDLFGPPWEYRGDGVSSGHPRSDLADAWWTRARDVYGLVSDVEGTIEQDFDIDAKSGFRSVVEEIAVEKLGAESADVSDYTVSASGTAKFTREAQAYHFNRATRKNLILAKMNLEAGELSGTDTKGFSDVNVKAMLAGNFGALGHSFREDKPEDDYDVFHSAQKLLDVLKHAGASKADIDRCRLRFLTGVDDDPRTWEELGDYGAFVPLRENPSAAVTRTRLAPRRRGARGWVLRRTFRHPVIWAPSRIPRVAYAQHRTNPSTLAAARPAAVREAVERVHALRAELGWGPFMADRGAP